MIQEERTKTTFLASLSADNASGGMNLIATGIGDNALAAIEMMVEEIDA